MEKGKLRRIWLVRHGEPSCEHRTGLSSRELGEWLKAYDASGLAAHSHPNAELLAIAARASIWSSDLRRTQESAIRLARPFRIDPLFREHEQPALWIPGLRLSTRHWDLVGKLAWFAGYSPQIESFRAARQRAAQAATRLVDESRIHGEVLLVGHGFFNILIGRELVKLGFRSPTGPQVSYWGCRELRSESIG